MKNFSLVLFLLLFSFCANGQIFKASDADKYAQGAELVRLNDFSKVPVYIKFSKSAQIDVDKAIKYTLSFIDNDNVDFLLQDVQKNKLNDQTYRYVQRLNGVPIEFSRWHLQVKNNKVFALNGEILDNPQVSNSFSLNPDDAFEIALKYFDGDVYMWDDQKEEDLLKLFFKDPSATYYPVAEKVFVPIGIRFENSDLVAAYKFNIYSKIPHDRRFVYVNAQSGEILFDLQGIHVSDETGTAQTVYSGERQIQTFFNGSQYVLTDNTRGDGVKTLNCNDGIEYGDATDFTDDDNYWNNVNPQLDEYATDAHFATAATYDYFLNVHGRNSIDGIGHPLWSFVHFSLIEYGYGSNVNAFWNGQWMTYGDGNIDNGITPLTTIDICAHEITHGLTSYTCNLNYINESGAINEAFSDIFGVAVEFYAAPEYADWTVGEDIGLVIRSIQNPKAYNKPDTYLGQYWVFGTEDYGGVHTNNGPLAYWFYLLCEGGSGTNDNGDDYAVEAIGSEKAEQIAFRLQTVYLTPNSNYTDAWFYAMQAAADLYGACSPEVKAVGDGFYAIGVAEPYVDEVHAGFDAVYTESCAPPFAVQFINQSYNGDSFLWNFGDGNTSTEINPSHTYTDFGSFDVSLSVDGSSCGDDVEIKNDYVIIDEAIPCLTLMPTAGSLLIENCNGIIYDAGGPAQNYFDNSYGSITIYAPGAEQIILNILEFDIEPGSGSYCDYDYIAFYDGENTSASLINSTYYCNTTGNPEIITSSGNYITIEFVSDGGLNLQGFKIQYDCIGSESPPTPYFSANKTITCDGLIEFSDNSLNFPSSWEWDFGDGNFSVEQNPTHNYLANGQYSVKLTVSNEFGDNELIKNNYINVDRPLVPNFTDIQACSDMNFIVDLDLEGTVYWYYDVTDTESFFVGNQYDHDAIQNPVTYYIQEIFESQDYYTGAINSTMGGAFFGNPSYIHYLVFDAYKPFNLESVKVNAQTAGNRTIAVRNSSSQILIQKSVFCPQGVSRIELDFDIPVGENLQLVGLGSPDLFRTDNTIYLNYPYNVEDILSIKYSSASTSPTGYYYYFYEWLVKSDECVSEIAELNLIPQVCTGSVIDEIGQEISVFPNPGDGLITVNMPETFVSAQIIISDISGKIIYSNLNYNGEVINITEKAPGIYLINLINDSQSLVLRYEKI